MDLGNCMVRLGGDLNNTVKKTMVTPAEVLVLKRLHGDDAVVEIVRTSKDANRPVKAELDRLREIYVDRFGAANPDRPNVVKELFPGASPNMPQTFDEVVGEGQSVGEEKEKAAEKTAVPAKEKLTLNTNPNTAGKNTDSKDAA